MTLKNEEDMARAIDLCKKFGGVNVATMQRQLCWGYNYCVAVLEELQRRGVLGRERSARHDACGAIFPLLTN